MKTRCATRRPVPCRAVVAPGKLYCAACAARHVELEREHVARLAAMPAQRSPYEGLPSNQPDPVDDDQLAEDMGQAYWL